jgi:hypothetical protein
MSEDIDAVRQLAAIDSYADAEAAAVVAQAQHEARARVQAMLADAIADRLLQSAHRHLELSAGPRRVDAAPATPTARRPAPERDPQPAGTPARDGEPGWYVYCIVGAGAIELDGISARIDDAHPLTLMRAGAVGAIASAVSLEEFGEVPMRERLDDLGWLEQTARAHEQVLDEVRGQTTVLPLRLCTVYRTEESVREMLARESRLLEATLARLAGKTEWGVKIFVHASMLEQELAAEDTNELEDPFAEARPGEAYMLSRRRETVRREELASIVEERCEQAHAELSAGASEVMLNQPQPPELAGHAGEMALNGAYLVEDARADEFAAVVERLQEQHAPALEIELTGPWPAYNFATRAVEVG